MTAPKRSCGECSLCCKLMKVNELNKPFGKWCQHARQGHGCAIYAERPGQCRTWNCYWLAGAEAEFGDLKRPDKAHYVIDEGHDLIKVEGKPMGAVQVFCDPAYPGAWRTDLALRRFMLRMAELGSATLVRFGDQAGARAIAVFAPPLTGGSWHEEASFLSARETTIEEKAAYFGADAIERRVPS